MRADTVKNLAQVIWKDLLQRIIFSALRRTRSTQTGK